MHVVVLGAGYAGVTVMRTLERSLPTSIELTIVDESPTHLVQHELHRVIRRPSIVEAIQVPLVELFDRAAVVTAHVEDVDLDARRVLLEDGSSIDYDYAAICIGADTDFYGLDGVEAHAIPLKRLEDAHRIRRRVFEVLESDDTATIVVGGAGLSGIQTAGELAALTAEAGVRDRVEIVLFEALDSVAPSFPPPFQRAVRDELRRRRVDIRTGTEIRSATARTIETDRGDVDYDLLVWTGGLVGPDALDGDRPTVRNDLRVNRSTFVLGDTARAIDADGEPVPASAAAAIREAKTTARNLTALVEHDLDPDPDPRFEPRMEPYRFDVPGWIVSIGDGAVAQIGPKVLTGSAAKAMKTTVGAGYLSSVRAIGHAVDLVEAELRSPR